MDYPKREPFFAMRFLRLLTKTAAAMELGSDGCLLLMTIVGQEDACRYSRPVNFWNAQLAVLCGIPEHNEKQLRRVRDRCVTAGWLHYESLGKRKHGRYFVVIPDHVIQDNDGGCDESPGNHVQEVSAKCPPSVRQVSAECPPTVRCVSVECPPSSPNPLPIPTPKSAAAPPPALHPEAPQRPPPIPKNDWIEWKRTRRIFVARSDEMGNQDEWRDLFRTAGPEVMTEAYNALIGDLPPDRGVGYAALQRWIFTHYQEPAPL